MSNVLTQSTAAVHRHTALIWRVEQLRGAEPQEMHYILHPSLCSALQTQSTLQVLIQPSTHSVHGDNYSKRSARKRRKGLCHSHIQTNKSHSLQPLSPGSHFSNSSSLWQLFIFPMLCHSLVKLQQWHAAPGVTAHKSTHIPLNKKITTHCSKKTHVQPKQESIFHIPTPALLQ